MNWFGLVFVVVTATAVVYAVWLAEQPERWR